MTIKRDVNSGSVVAVVKHWVACGAAKDCWDGHNYYGRFADFSVYACLLGALQWSLE